MKICCSVCPFPIWASNNFSATLSLLLLPSLSSLCLSLSFSFSLSLPLSYIGISIRLFSLLTYSSMAGHTYCIAINMNNWVCFNHMCICGRCAMQVSGFYRPKVQYTIHINNVYRQGTQHSQYENIRKLFSMNWPMVNIILTCIIQKKLINCLWSEEEHNVTLRICNIVGTFHLMEYFSASSSVFFIYFCVWSLMLLRLSSCLCIRFELIWSWLLCLKCA